MTAFHLERTKVKALFDIHAYFGISQAQTYQSQAQPSLPILSKLLASYPGNIFQFPTESRFHCLRVLRLVKFRNTGTIWKGCCTVKSRSFQIANSFTWISKHTNSKTLFSSILPFLLVNFVLNTCHWPILRLDILCNRHIRGFFISSQLGPLIFLLIKSSSRLEVLVPNTWENVSPFRSWGSREKSAWEKKYSNEPYYYML